jgi:hypothetical protein
MDKNTKNLLCGLVLGDGTVHKRGKRFQMQHSIKQLEYLKYKVSLLKDVGFDLEIQTFECNGYQECRCGFSNDYFTRIRKWLYKTGKKVIKKEFLLRLTDREIALWYMDDGSLYKHKGKLGKSGDSYELCIATYCDTEEQAVDLIKFFKQRYDADFTIKRNKGKFSIRCGKKAAIKVLNKLDKYIPECMSYKTFR